MTRRAKRLYVDRLRRREKATRALWQVVYAVFFATARGPLLKGWRRSLLRAFGAQIGTGCKIEATCRVWLPSNLSMGDYSCLAGGVDCYNVAPIMIGSYATVSQRSFLCTASHATDTLALPLIFAPISIGDHAWICAEAFVGPGVKVGEGAVLGARGLATSDLGPWGVYAGIPARRMAERVIRESAGPSLS
jgi:putative colanic acid biosynthesis acetyltransferase WcaF